MQSLLVTMCKAPIRQEVLASQSAIDIQTRKNEKQILMRERLRCTIRIIAFAQNAAQMNQINRDNTLSRSSAYTARAATVDVVRLEVCSPAVA
jgi:hypothetical protein